MYLSWIDYGLLALLLCFSAAIGIYHGCIRSRQLTTKEFLIANGRMGILPTAMSMYATLVSAATLLGVPVEIYAYGTKYLLYIVGWFFGTYFTANLFIPKFRQIKCISIYSYLERRFSLPVRIVVTMNFISIIILFMAVNLYGPSLALSQVTGLNTWLAIGACGFICTLYTSIGGMKAVIWTDVIQTVIMFLGVILSIVLGFIDNGGVRKVFQIALTGDRLNMPSVSLNPSVRYTALGLVIGGSLYATATYASLQTCAQRFMCVKSTRAAQRVAWLGYAFIIITLFLCSLVALILYAKYSQCDPLRAKIIVKPDQLYPLFVVQTFGQYPGLTGLFIGSILSASLSTVSSGINSITTVIPEDIYKRISIFPSISDERQALISKVLSIVFGILTTLIAFLMSYLGNNIIVIVYQIVGSLVPPILSVFLLGFFAPRVNSRSVLFAFIACLLFQSWVLIGAILTAKQYAGQDGRLPVSVDGCLSSLNWTRPTLVTQKSNILLPLYSISFVWYNFNGVFLTIILGLLGTLVFGSNDPQSIDKSLLCSWKDAFGCGSTTQTTDQSVAVKNPDIELEKPLVEGEQLL